jgi:hypothetical protein
VVKVGLTEKLITKLNEDLEKEKKNKGNINNFETIL